MQLWWIFVPFVTNLYKAFNNPEQEETLEFTCTAVFQVVILTPLLTEKKQNLKQNKIVLSNWKNSFFKEHCQSQLEYEKTRCSFIVHLIQEEDANTYSVQLIPPGLPWSIVEHSAFWWITKPNCFTPEPGRSSKIPILFAIIHRDVIAFTLVLPGLLVMKLHHWLI